MYYCAQVNDVRGTTKKTITQKLNNLVELSNNLKTIDATVQVQAGFSTTGLGIDDKIMMCQQFNLQSSLKNTSTENFRSKPVIPLKKLFQLADELNVFAIASKENYDPNGSLKRIELTTEEIRGVFENNVTNFIFKIIPGEVPDEDDEGLESFLSLAKQFELPADLIRIDFDQNGNISGTYTEQFKPSKVKILSSTMSPDMQLVVAEALKKTCIMKQKPYDRIKLLIKYLEMKYGSYEWQGCACKGSIYVANDVMIDLELGGQSYTIWAEKLE